jgi:hypothetical protein
LASVGGDQAINAFQSIAQFRAARASRGACSLTAHIARDFGQGQISITIIGSVVDAPSLGHV